MAFFVKQSFDFWIIGYGNPQRRHDGIGPYIVNRLQPLFKHRKDVHLLVFHQLEPDIIDTLKTADTLVFVDASVDVFDGGAALGSSATGTQPNAFPDPRVRAGFHIGIAAMPLPSTPENLDGLRRGKRFWLRQRLIFRCPKKG